MKKVIKLLTSLCSFLLIGCSSSQASSEIMKDDGNQEGLSIYPTHSRGSGYVGDPMPYYENGKMYVYYLEDARNYRTGYHPISLLETTDFTHYEDKGIMLMYEDDIYSPELALATGSVIKDKEGGYHFFYGGFNSSSSGNLPYYQIVEHATSDDLYNWTKHSEYGFYGEHNDFRDPYVLYMEEEDTYWMLVTSRIGNVSTVKKYTSKDLWEWDYEGPFYQNARFNNMECSSLIYYKGYWYYSFSENGEHGYTYYMYKRNLSDPNWIEPNAILDGFYAGRPVIGKDGRLFIYGWAPTKGGYDSSKSEWAGNLTCMELVQQENGELFPTLPHEIKDELSYEVNHNALRTEKPMTDFSLSSNSFIQSISFHGLDKNRITRFSFDFTLDSIGGHAGITFGCLSDNELGLIAFDFSSLKQQLLFYNACSRDNLGGIEYAIPFNFVKDKKYHVDMVYHDLVTTLYLNDEAALAMRTYAPKKDNFAFYALNNEVTFSEVRYYE